MAVFIGKDTFNRIGSAVRRVEGSPLAGRTEPFPLQPGEVPLRWFELTYPLGSAFCALEEPHAAGRDGYAKAKLLSYDPSKAGEMSGLYDAYYIEGGAKEVEVHCSGFTNNWGFAGERGLARLVGYIDTSGNVVPHWEIVVNPGQPAYWVRRDLIESGNIPVYSWSGDAYNNDNVIGYCTPAMFPNDQAFQRWHRIDFDKIVDKNLLAVMPIRSDELAVVYIDKPRATKMQFTIENGAWATCTVDHYLDGAPCPVAPQGQIQISNPLGFSSGGGSGTFTGIAEYDADSDAWVCTSIEKDGQ